MPAPVSRRRVLAGAGLLLAGIGGLTACGAEGPAVSGPAPAAPGFPVTIRHRLGETVIPDRPRRVVTLGASNTDVALAMGVLPVAIPKTTYGGDAEGVLPWVRTAIERTGGPFPQVIGSGDVTAVPFEGVAAAKPDLVLATYSGLTPQEYAQLSEIAPTVAYPDAEYSTGWREQTRVAGQVFGDPARADRLIADTEAQLAGATQRYPQLAGKTFVYTGGLDGGRLGLFRAADARVQLVTDLGLTLDGSAERDAVRDGSVYYTVSPELLSRIDSDLVIGFFASDDDVRRFRTDAAVATMPAVRRRGLAAVVGNAKVVATSAPSVLSLPWVLGDYLPVLARAADGKA
ncbi:ABC transporter substrate-binding protein [Pseudonocardia phyllosphaerae]|uniref:ABC transporter substrate-binding protein n=1 Tax=Pseudonocardia phyllosphaerae TaxID=3390502 RepID=UPI0039795B78